MVQYYSYFEVKTKIAILSKKLKVCFYSTFGIDFENLIIIAVSKTFLLGF